MDSRKTALSYSVFSRVYPEERKGRTGFDHHRYNTKLALAPDWGPVRSRLRIDIGVDTHRVVVSLESPTDRGARQGHASAFFNASHAARCVARHGVRSHAVLVALVGECSMPVV
jgi:hypothetical protein